MFDPVDDLRWTGGITASTQHEPDRLVELTVDRPCPMTVRYELEPRQGRPRPPAALPGG